MPTLRPLFISTGKVADGEDRYFPRSAIQTKIWDKLVQGENLLLAAPRRTGKSSILKYLEKHPRPGFRLKYKAVQSIDTGNEFFKHLFILLLEDDRIFSHYQRYLKKASATLQSLISRIRGIHIEGIEMGPETPTDYYAELISLLKTIPKDTGTIVFLLDEFPDAIKNIEDNTGQGVLFLQQNRDLRQEIFNVDIRFVYTGSIGLGNIVKRLGRLDLITDIPAVKVNPLTRDQSRDLIHCLWLGVQQKNPKVPVLSPGAVDRILGKESWRIPYYIQIIMEELCDTSLETEKSVDAAAVDQAIRKIITDRYTYQDYFENWKTRLKQALAGDEYRLALDILNHIASRGDLDRDRLHDMAVKRQVAAFKEVLGILEYDGYISPDEKGLFRFNSIILKEWWFINVSA